MDIHKHVIIKTQRDFPYDFGKIDTVLTAIIDRIEFFGTPKKERFLIRGHFPKSFKLTLKMADPYTLQVYSAINLLKHDGHEIEVFTVHQKHIIRVWKNHLFVQELVENLWTEYLRSVIGDKNKIQTFFCGETVKKMLMDTLDNYKSDPESTPKKHTFQGDSISWSVTYHDRFETRRYFALKAHILKHEDKEEESQENEEKSREPVEISVELPSSHFLLGGSTYFMECKLLESEDFLMITPIEGIIVNLESIIDADHLKFSINKLLPPPHFNWIVKMRKRSTWYTDYDKGWKGWGTNAPNFQDLLDYYMDDVLLLELYGDVLMCALLQEDDDDLIEAFFKKYLKLSEFQIEDGNLSSFSKLANIIFSSLPKLSEKSFTFVTRLLAHLAFIPSHNFKDSLVSNSDASHLQHCGEYFHLTKTSLINRNYASSNPPYLSSSLLEMINMTIKVDTIEGVGLKIDGIEKKINGIEGEVKHMMKSEGVENRFNEFGEDIKNIEEKLNIIMNLVEKLSSSQKDSEDNGNRDEV
ncbi:21540_t:CDS:2 [Gigaspora margarita]|uniref:21540_t:CDS:1 n=1 Tax=Gigaspora margarita TaxID=4874 RepID=A0ABN7UK04_GIGMA|nr:21540_t:CDS:2 [Gigaspora margarita]